MRNKKHLNVIYVVDINFVIHFTVSLTSLLENNKDIEVSVFVIHDIGNVNQLNTAFLYFQEKYSIQINFLSISKDLLKKLDKFPISGNISKATYFKFLFSDLIPSEVESCLYLDSDTIITSSLRELVEINLFQNGKNEEHYLLAVKDINEKSDIIRLGQEGINLKSYFNAGVMLINLKKWRLENSSFELMRSLQKHENIILWHDQDVLNIHFKDRFGELNTTFNSFAAKKLDKLPTIIHFSGNSKPWQYTDISPYKKYYWYYLKLTPFKNHKFEKITLIKIKQKYTPFIKELIGV